MAGRLHTFGHLLRHRPHFRRLYLASVISMLGDWLSYVAVSVVTLQHGGGALAVGLIMVAHTLPVALTSPIAGPLADRMDRRTLLVAVRLAAGLLTLGMWLATRDQQVGVLQVLLLLRVGVSGIAMTTGSAALPSLVEPSELRDANALNGLTWSVLFAAGTALGGLLAAWLGAGEAILLDALTFFASAALMPGLPRLHPPPAAEARPRPGFKDLAVAWRHARGRGASPAPPELLPALLAKTPLALLTASCWISLHMVADARSTALAAASVASGLGLMHATRALGTGIGPLIPRHWLPAEANVAAPLALLGGAAFLLSGSPWIFLPGLFLWGAGSGHNWVASTATLQVQSPGHLIGRMSALDLLFSTLAQAVVAVGAGLLIDATGVAESGGWLGIGLAFALWVPLMALQTRRQRVEV
ncbi:MAG: MFS transporter, partial [bacterium]